MISVGIPLFGRGLLLTVHFSFWGGLLYGFLLLGFGLFAGGVGEEFGNWFVARHSCAHLVSPLVVNRFE